MTDTVVLQHSTDDATEQKQTNLSREEIEEVFIQQYSGLARNAKRWSRDDDEDIVQEVFLKLLKQTERPDSIERWLFWMANNTATDWHRRLQRQRKRDLEYVLWKRRIYLKNSQNKNGEFTYNKIPWSESTVTLKVKAKEEKQAKAVSKLNELPADEREIITLRIWEGFTFNQIAEKMRMSRSSAQRKYVDTLSKLKKTWDDKPGMKPHLPGKTATSQS